MRRITLLDVYLESNLLKSVNMALVVRLLGKGLHVNAAAVTALCLLLNTSAFAQCAMCRGTVESNMNTGASTTAGLNTGIVYLMVVPYVMFAALGYFWYKRSKENQKRNGAKLRVIRNS